jgi:hypothetical protein
MTTQTLHLIDEYLTQGGYTPGIDAETLEREAHLIAAAPDLLAALIDAVAMMDAIAKGQWNWDGSTEGQAKSVARDAIAAITKAKGN